MISKHTFSLAQYVFRNLTSLHHSNGQPVAVLYHDSHFEDRNVQGGIVNFNLLRADGQYVGYAEVFVRYELKYQIVFVYLIKIIWFLRPLTTQVLQYLKYIFQVLHMANLFGIVLRTGCCCNPGACQRFLGLNDEDVIKHFMVILKIVFK